QLEVAGAAAAQNEAAQKQAQERRGQVKQKLAGLREPHRELNARSTKEQAASAEAGKRLRELEERLGQRTAESEKAKGELEKRAKIGRAAWRGRRKELEEAGAVEEQNEADKKQGEGACGQLE